MDWDEKFAIGIDEIDRQHRILLDYFSLLHDAIKLGQRWSTFYFPLIRLKEGAQFLFMLEESLMIMSEYPGTQDHIEAHRKILRQLGELELKSLHRDLVIEDAQFLRDWLIGHIIKSDRDYARHFATGGRIIVKET